MKFASLRNSVFGSALAMTVALLLGSCGGGGASNAGPIGGPPFIQPEIGTFYAGVEYTFTTGGGRPPYFLSSSEPSLMAVPTSITGNFFTVIPNNTGVVNVGLTPEDLPVRAVTIFMRDSIGNNVSTGELQVAQNFFTGYGVSYVSNCGAGAGDSPPACAGGETVVSLAATINGNRFGNRTYRFEVARGPMSWLFPNGGIAGNTITATTDHEGRVNVILRVNNNVTTQIGVIRVTDLATGTMAEHLLLIDGTDIGGELEILPSAFTFTGPNTATCGTGSADFLVFDGQPPYRAVSSFPSILVNPAVSNSQPGRFTLAASDPFTCITDGTIVVTDANNSRGTVTVTTEAGEAAAPPPPMSVTPSQMTLDCGQTGSASIIGGGGTFSASTTDPDLTVAVLLRTLTITRNGVPPATPPNVNSTVTVTDGTSTATVTVANPTTCS